MDSIREALGAKQINYYGFSYGTYLGQVYATLFPTHVRRMVLDSNVDPRSVWYQANLDQDIAFERNIKIWFALGREVRLDLPPGQDRGGGRAALVRRAEQAARSSRPAARSVADEWNDIFLVRRLLPADLARPRRPRSRPGCTTTTWQALVAEYLGADGPGDDNGFAIYNAVAVHRRPVADELGDVEEGQLGDVPEGPVRDVGQRLVQRAVPVLAGQGAHAGHDRRQQGRSALLIDETLDAATPYPGSLEVRKLFPNSSLIAMPGGTSHANSLYGNACVDNQIADYLATGKLPARKAGNGADTTCAPLPEPVPTAAAVTSAAAASSKAASSPARAAVRALMRAALR